ncbi:MAG: hypothetical protein ACK5LR_06010 [Mangrovibacterium sp.]
MKHQINWIKVIICSLFLLGSASGVLAQENPYVVELDGDTVIVNLGLDVLGKMLTQEGGYWDEIKGPTYVADEVPLRTRVSAVQLVSNWAVGEYYFVYHATNSRCLPSGEVSEVAVIVIKKRTAFIHAPRDGAIQELMNDTELSSGNLDARKTRL